MKEIMKNLKELMMKIDKFNSQQLNMLVEHIFDISNEDDILAKTMRVLAFCIKMFIFLIDL